MAGAAEETWWASTVIIATGSNARALPGVPFDEVILCPTTARCALAPPQEAGCDWLGRDWPGNGLRRGAAWVRMSRFWKVCPRSWAPWTSRSPGRPPRRSTSKVEIELGVKVGEIKNSKGREHCLHQCQG